MGQQPPATAERCRLLLEHWCSGLTLSGRERSLFAGQLAQLERQLGRLQRRQLRLAVFGRVGVGKSSLLNALLGEPLFATDVAHGCTRRQQIAPWLQPIPGLDGLELVDTPGIDEIAAPGRARLAARVALGADLVILVIDADLSSVELEAIVPLAASGKPLLLVLNRCDCWPAAELQQLIASIRSRLPAALALEPIAVAAAPRQAELLADGRVRSRPGPPRIEPLRQRLIELLTDQGVLLLALNSLAAAERLQQALQRQRLRSCRQAADSLIGRYAALKATGVAANPLPLLDLAAGLACDTALVVQLAQLYGLPLGGASARQLAARLSGHNSLLAGAQLAIQTLLGGIKQLLLVAAPLTAGLSLAPAAPVALAQVALAVHTTRLTGRLAARALLRSANRRHSPGALMRRLAQTDPQLRQWLLGWSGAHGRQPKPGRAPLP